MWKGTNASNAPLGFGDWLREQRASTWSIEEAAERFGVPAQTWRAWEAGFRVPRLPMLIELCRFLGVDMVNVVSEWGSR